MADSTPDIIPGAAEEAGSSNRAKIHLLDQAEIHDGMVEAYRAACIDQYLPEASVRGMTLEAVWLSPPLILRRGGNTLYFLWSFPDLDSFWRARFLDAEAKREWWAATAHMVRSRSRAFLSDFMRADHVHAPVTD